MLGLDAAGKTTMMYKICENRYNNQVNFFECGSYGVHFNITSWDSGGQDRMKKTYRCMYQGRSIKAIVFLIDSADHERLDEAKKELHWYLNENFLEGIPLLIFATKQDLPRALGIEEIKKHLDLDQLCGKIPFLIRGSCISSINEVTKEAFEWLLMAITDPENNITYASTDHVKSANKL